MQSLHLAAPGNGISAILNGSIVTGFWVNRAGYQISHIDTLGAVINQISGGVISSSWYNVKYIPFGGRKYVSVVGKNEATEGLQIQVWDVTDNEVYPTLVGKPALTNIYNANTNATGDIAWKDNGDGTFTLYQLVTNNGIAAWKSKFASIQFQVNMRVKILKGDFDPS